MNKIFYDLDEKSLTATFWQEGKEKEKETAKGKWQKYSGDRASKNNTRIIFNKLPAFCSPQVTITLNPKEPKGSFIPKLNTKTNNTATKTANIELLQISKFAEYLEEEKDKKAFAELLEKAKQVFAKKQAEQHKISVNSHIAGLAKLGISGEALIQLLQKQLEETAKAKAEEEKAKAETAETATTETTEPAETAEKGGKNE